MKMEFSRLELFLYGLCCAICAALSVVFAQKVFDQIWPDDRGAVAAIAITPEVAEETAAALAVGMNHSEQLLALQRDHWLRGTVGGKEDWDQRERLVRLHEESGRLIDASLTWETILEDWHND